MIDVANKYEEKLQKLFADTWYDEKFKFYYTGGYSENFKVSDSNWDSHEFVSKNTNGNIIGYIAYTVDRWSNKAYGLRIINFTEDKITFGKDLYKVLHDIFGKYHFRKLCFSVTVGNPVERSYDRWVKRYGGRVVGVYKQDTKLIDNEYYDSKEYEIMLDDYLRCSQVQIS